MQKELTNRQKMTLFFMLFASLVTSLQKIQATEIPSFEQFTPSPRSIDGAAYPRGMCALYKW